MTTKVRAEQIKGLAKSFAPILNSIEPVYANPNVTLDIVCKGEFFNPETSVALSGQTVNNVRFISTSEIVVNITTGNIDFENVDIHFNNGIEIVYKNAFLINIGEVVIPTTEDWQNITGQIDLSQTGSAKLVALNTSGTADFNYLIPPDEDFMLDFVIKKSPLDSDPTNANVILLIDSVDGVSNLYMAMRSNHNTDYNFMVPYDRNGFLGAIGSSTTWGKKFGIKRKAGIVSILYNDAVVKTSNLEIINSMIFRISISQIDVTNIRYIKI